MLTVGSVLWQPGWEKRTLVCGPLVAKHLVFQKKKKKRKKKKSEAFIPLVTLPCRLQLPSSLEEKMLNNYRNTMISFFFFFFSFFR